MKHLLCNVSFVPIFPPLLCLHGYSLVPSPVCSLFTAVVLKLFTPSTTIMTNINHVLSLKLRPLKMLVFWLADTQILWFFRMLISVSLQGCLICGFPKNACRILRIYKQFSLFCVCCPSSEVQTRENTLRFACLASWTLIPAWLWAVAGDWQKSCCLPHYAMLFHP